MKQSKINRKERAVARQQARNELGPAAQLAILDQRLGAGKGAKRERARLTEQLANQ